MSDLNKVLLIGRVVLPPSPLEADGSSAFTLVADLQTITVCTDQKHAKDLGGLTTGKLVYVEGRLCGDVVQATHLTEKKEH